MPVILSSPVRRDVTRHEFSSDITSASAASTIVITIKKPHKHDLVMSVQKDPQNHAYNYQRKSSIPYGDEKEVSKAIADDMSKYKNVKSYNLFGDIALCVKLVERVHQNQKANKELLTEFRINGKDSVQVLRDYYLKNPIRAIKRF